jgi:RNA polymerase sigma factor (sigma-70 family)
MTLTQARSGADLNRLMTELYIGEYSSLLRLASWLVRDVQTAEEVVQDAFMAMHRGLPRLRDSDRALSYLRQAVVNRSHSVLRHRSVIDRNIPDASPSMPSAEQQALERIEGAAAVRAMRSLSPRQRHVFLLHVSGYSAVEIAQITQITASAVRSHVHLARRKLRDLLSDPDPLE